MDYVRVRWPPAGLCNALILFYLHKQRQLSTVIPAIAVAALVPIPISALAERIDGCYKKAGVWLNVSDTDIAEAGIEVDCAVELVSEWETKRLQTQVPKLRLS